MEADSRGTVGLDAAMQLKKPYYEINKEEQQIVANVGDLRRLTVAVIIDGTYDICREQAAAPQCDLHGDQRE